MKKKGKLRSVTLACVPVCYDENGSDAAFAVLTLTARFIETLLARISLGRGLRAIIDGFCHIEEFDYSVEYVKYDCELRKNLEQDSVDDAWEIVDASAPKCAETVRVEASTRVTTNTVAYWQAYIKNTNIMIATAHLNEIYLKELLANLDERR